METGKKRLEFYGGAGVSLLPFVIFHDNYHNLCLGINFRWCTLGASLPCTFDSFLSVKGQKAVFTGCYLGYGK